MGGGNLNKGFAISGVLYPILILVVFIIVQMLTMLGTRKMVLDQNRNQLIESLNSSGRVYTNEELTELFVTLQSQIVQDQEQISSLKEKLSAYTLKTDFNALNLNVNERFPSYFRSEVDYKHSCGTTENLGIRKFLQDKWNTFAFGISLRQVNSYGCNYMVVINKSSNDYGTILLSGYENTHGSLIIGSHWTTNWYWTKANVTNLPAV